MILIKNGRLIDPKSGVDTITDLVLSDGKIHSIGKTQGEGNFKRIIDAAGKIVAPGLVDIHVHFREPGFTYKEDILTGAKSAAAGGFTSVVCMANTSPIIDNEQTLNQVRKLGEKTDINVYTCASVTKGFLGKELVEMEHLKNIGAKGFTDDGISIMDETVLYKALLKAKELDLPVSLHEEHPKFIDSPGVNKGEVSKELGLGGAPKLSESIMVWRDVALAIETGAKMNIQHISAKSSLDAIRAGKKLGAKVFCEVTPHHFSSTEELVKEKGTLAKMNPPLRDEPNRQAIIKGLQDGTIDFIATDHAPHSEKEKSATFNNAPSGIIGLETALALGVTNLVKENYISLNTLIDKMSRAPAELYNFDAGYINVGGPADLVIFDENEKWIVKDDFHSKSKNTPYIGYTLLGKVKYTICKGKVIYQD